MDFNSGLINIIQHKNSIHNYLIELDLKKKNGTIDSEKYEHNKKVYRSLIEKDDACFKMEQERIINCSTFNLYLIYNSIARIVRIYEDKSLFYQEIPYQKSCNGEEAIVKLILLVFDENKITNEEINDKEDNFHKIARILNNGFGFVLDKTKKSTNQVTFYNKNEKGFMEQCIGFSKFEYVKNFINYLISYRLYEDLIYDISDEQLKKLEDIYIYSHANEIREYHKFIKFEEKRKYEKKLEEDSLHREKILTRALKRYTDN